MCCQLSTVPRNIAIRGCNNMMDRDPIEASFQFSISGEPSLVSVEGHIRDLLGLEPDDFLQSRVSLFDRFHRGDIDAVTRLFGPAVKRHSSSMNLRIRHADGRIRCVRAQFEKLTAQNGPVMHVRLQDAKSLSHRLLQQSETLPQSVQLIENTEEPLFSKDCCHVFTAASANFNSNLSHELGGREVVGLTDYDFLAEEEADVYYRVEEQVLTQSAPSTGVQQVRRSSGTLGEIRFSEWPITSTSGAIVGIIARAENITSGIQPEEDLDESVEALRKSQEIALIGSYLFDPSTSTWVASKLLDRILGFAQIGRHSAAEWEGIVHPDDRDALLTHFNHEVLQSQTTLNCEYRIIRPNDGSVRWVHALGEIELDDHGQPLMRGTVQDITDRRFVETELRETQERLRLFIEHAPAALAMFDCEMRYLAVSQRWLEAFNMTGQDILGRWHYEIFPDLPERWREMHRRGLAGESMRNNEDRFEREDGSLRWSRWEILPWRNVAGKVGGIVVFVEDITASKQTEKRLQLAATVFQHAGEGIMVTDLNGTIVEVNESFTRITGYTREEVIGGSPRILNSGRQDNKLYQEMWQTVFEKGRWRGELWNRSKNGELFAASSTITTVLDAEQNPQYYVEMFLDVTPIKEQQRKLDQISLYDVLTALPRRELFTERLRHAMTLAKQRKHLLAVCYFDLDAFKAINDIHGRDAADALLVAVAGRMKQAVREGDMIARMGGDEFVAVLRDFGDEESASHAVLRLMEAAAQSFEFDGRTLTVTATAGVTFYPQPEEVDADQLIRQADVAMYEAKLSGKNRSHLYDPRRGYSLRGQQEEIDQIRQALLNQEFVLYYQPVVNMANGELIGAEALIRWQHPQHGLLLPGKFLPAIEDHDLMNELGTWVLATAMKQIAAWSSEGRQLRVSVNVSAKQLEQPDFIEGLRALLSQHPDTDPSLLELEVLETSALEDIARVSAIIGACRDLGIWVAIDDFGTGYSSLTYLKRLPATILKIDQSFIRGMLEDPDDLTILQGVMGLATAFRRTPIAEGVESVEQGMMLLRHGCLYGQGFGIARPMPAADLLEWSASWRPDPTWRSVVPVSSFDWPILVAQVEIERWNRDFRRLMAGERSTAPELDECRCRIGLWLDSERQGPRGESPMLQEIDRLHRRAHQLTRQAIDLKNSGRSREGEHHMQDVIRLRQEIRERLDRMILSREPAAQNPVSYNKG